MNTSTFMMSPWKAAAGLLLVFQLWLPGALGQSGLTPVVNPSGLEDQRLQLLSAEGYQLIEQANQALEAQLLLRAQDRIAQLLYQYTGSLIALPGNAELPYRSFSSVPAFVRAWHRQSGTTSASSEDSEKQKQVEVLRRGLSASLRYARFAPADTVSSEWYLALCDALIESGDLEAARILLGRQSMSPVIGVNGTYTGKWQRSSGLSATQRSKLIVRHVVLEILEGRASAAREVIGSLTEEEADIQVSLGGLDGTLQEVLWGFYQQHFGGSQAGVKFVPTVARKREAGRMFDAAELWQRDFAGLLNGKGIAERLDVRIKVMGDRLYANTMNGILALDLEDGTPLFGDLPDSYWLFRSQQDEVADWYDPEIPYWGNCIPDVDVQGDLLAARQGDPALTHHLSVEAADIRGNSVVVLDLSEQGRMLDGFPLTLPAASQESYQVFASDPRLTGEHVLVGIRENQAFQCRHYVACYDLSGGNLVWKCYVGAARPIANRTITDLMSAGLDVVGGQVIYTTNTGLVASVDLSGQLNWVCSYPRSYHAIASAELEKKQVRRSTVGFDREDMTLLIAPADSMSVFSLDIQSGLPVGSFDEPSLSQLEISVLREGRVLLCGDRIWQMVTAEDGNREPVRVPAVDSLIQRSVHVDANHVYGFSSDRRLLALSWDDMTEQSIVNVSTTSMASVAQLEMNHRLAILFDGKMIRAIKTAPVTPQK